MKIRVKVEKVETYEIELTTGETYTIESNGTGSRAVTGRVIGRDGRDLLVRNGKKITAIPMARIKSAARRGVLSPNTPDLPVPAMSTNGTRKKAVRRATRKSVQRRGVARV